MIHINGKIWRVRLVPPYHPALYRRGNPALGCCDDRTKTIYISNVMSNNEIRDILCHELVHAVMYSYDINISDNIEEIIADVVMTYGDEIIELTHMVYDKILENK